MPRIAVRSKPPTFSQPYLQSFLVCSCFKLSDSALSRRVKKLERADEREARFESSKGPAWIRVRIGRRDVDGAREDIHGRWQIDCALESLFSTSRSQTAPPNSLDEVWEYLRLALRQKADVTCCNGRFFVPKTELPVEGITRLLLGVSARVAKAKMNLTGATFDVHGNEPIDEVKWDLRPRKGKDEADELDLTIRAFPHPSRLGGELEKIAQMLSDSVQRLVIETGD